MKWRCVNDFWGYCKGEPDWKRKSQAKGGYGYQINGACMRSPENCTKYVTFERSLKNAMFAMQRKGS